MAGKLRLTILGLCGALGVAAAVLLAGLLAQPPAPPRDGTPASPVATLPAPVVDEVCADPVPAGAVHHGVIFGATDPLESWPAQPKPDPVSDTQSWSDDAPVAAVPDPVSTETAEQAPDGPTLAALPRQAPPVEPTPVVVHRPSRQTEGPKLAQPRVSTAPRLDNPLDEGPREESLAQQPAAASNATSTAPDNDDLAGSLSRVAVKTGPRPQPRRPHVAQKQPAPQVIQPRPAVAQNAAAMPGMAGLDVSKLIEMYEQVTAGSGMSSAEVEKNRELLEQVQRDGPAALANPAAQEQLKSVASSLQQALGLPGDDEDSQPRSPLEADDRPRPEGAGALPAPRRGGMIKPKTAKPVAEEDLQIIDEGDGKLYVHIQQEELRKVLELLSEQGGMNILASPSVEGNVSASLNGVGVEEALAAILRSTGFISRRDGNFIYVGTPEDFQSQDRAIDQINTRVYRPNYTAAADLKQLIEPLLTETVGKATVTAPAQIGIGTNSTTVGGDSFASSDAVVVQDYEAVLAQVDQLVDEVDQRPPQVAIEAMILSVNLNDENQFGINWEMLRNQPNVRFGIGTPRQAPLEGSGKADSNTGAIIGQYNYTGGLSYAFLDSSLGSFLNALETIGDTDVIATPRLMCLNKQRAEILIGAQLGYISTTVTETSTAQSVQFLEVGAQLRLRPFISNDGLIRMEVHPELSTGQVRVASGFTLPDKEVTQVTTNVLVRDGCTVIIGGLMREDLSTSTSQLPLVGNLPVVGGLFRQKTEKRQKREILVLITPHVISDAEAHLDGENGALEFHRRHGVVADKMNPVGKRLLGRKYLRKAQLAWAENDEERALKLANWAVQFDPQNRAAIDLRADIEAGRHSGDHSGGARPPQWPLPQSPDDGDEAHAEALYDELEHGAEAPGGRDLGTPGSRSTLSRVEH